MKQMDMLNTELATAKSELNNVVYEMKDDLELAGVKLTTVQTTEEDNEIVAQLSLVNQHQESNNGPQIDLNILESTSEQESSNDINVTEEMTVSTRTQLSEEETSSDSNVSVSNDDNDIGLSETDSTETIKVSCESEKTELDIHNSHIDDNNAQTEIQEAQSETEVMVSATDTNTEDEDLHLTECDTIDTEHSDPALSINPELELKASETLASNEDTVLESTVLASDDSNTEQHETDTTESVTVSDNIDTDIDDLKTDTNVQTDEVSQSSTNPDVLPMSEFMGYYPEDDVSDEEFFNQGELDDGFSTSIDNEQAYFDSIAPQQSTEHETEAYVLCVINDKVAYLHNGIKVEAVEYQPHFEVGAKVVNY